MARADHPIRSLPIGVLEQLVAASNSFAELLASGSHDSIELARDELRAISDIVPIDQLPNPLDILEPIPTGIDDLPTTGGIYLFSSDAGHYLGLTENIRVRFYIPSYGHLTPNNISTSRHVIDSDGGWQAYILESYTSAESRSEDANRLLSSDEIFWYYLLRNHPEFEFVNSERNIGHTSDHSGFPTLTYHEEERIYALFPSIGAATRACQVNSGNALRHMLRATTSRYGSVRMLLTTPNVPMARFYFRFATDEEAALLGTEMTYDQLLTTIRGRTSDCDLIYRDGEENDRNSRLIWNSGEISSRVIERLEPYKRGAYNLDGPQSQFDHGISWDSTHDCWQIRAKNGPLYTDLWKGGRPGYSEIDAAIDRERVIVSNNWQQYNLPGRRGYPSNVEQINRLLPEENHLIPW